MYRKLHKKDAGSDAEKKKRVRRAQKSQRAIVGASLEVKMLFFSEKMSSLVVLLNVSLSLSFLFL